MYKFPYSYLWEDKDSFQIEQFFIQEYECIIFPDYGDFLFAIQEAKRKSKLNGTDLMNEFTFEDMCFLLNENSYDPDQFTDI